MKYPPPAVVSVEMGYGHLRAALPLVEALGTPLLHVDRPPLADQDESRLWARTRRIQDILSKPIQIGIGLMDEVTKIRPLYSELDLSTPSLGVRGLDALIDRGLGRGLVRYLKDSRAPLLTTFYAPAIIADRAGLPSYCVVTDADINRVWAPMDGRRSRIRYFVPSSRAVRRLRAYGVLAEHITLTGFPLPEELVGGPDASLAREHLARSLVRLDPCRRFRALHGPDVERTVGPLPSEEEGKPPRLVFAVGGAGAQAEFALDFLPSLRDPIRSGRIELTLVAGTRPDVANVFERALTQAGLSGAVPVLLGANFGEYYRRFNALLASTDILWTKPSELSFYAGLGAALVLAPPVGSHERYNQLWLREQGAALSQDSAAHAAAWLGEWFEDGTLAAAAWTAFVRLPKDGARRIARAVTSELRDDDVPAAGSHRAQS